LEVFFVGGHDEVRGVIRHLGDIHLVRAMIQVD
jgi:hypothetical protein